MSLLLLFLAICSDWETGAGSSIVLTGGSVRPSAGTLHLARGWLRALPILFTQRARSVVTPGLLGASVPRAARFGVRYHHLV